VVIAGLDPAIHEASQQVQPYIGLQLRIFIMDARVKPGHDAQCVATPYLYFAASASTSTVNSGRVKPPTIISVEAGAGMLT
jgi:hypothetical protein